MYCIPYIYFNHLDFSGVFPKTDCSKVAIFYGITKLYKATQY